MLKKIVAHISTFIILIFLTIYFLLATINSAVSKKYEVFNPSETYYYSTLKTQAEKTDYINKVEHNNFVIKGKVYIYFILTILSFLAGFVILYHRNRTSRRKNIIN
ncbi:hypothetical protein RM553_02005 [Zunongwangia sp. F363]|uniref:NADH dehydrogenase subunit 6 n=1 Tax=Autumnicola tepida TaxID=3075595 RepID=A0ABU3C5J0_9FLAO|nr:hypothetical protein [Zunongwangia sp. F363]MDT0641595.1 hypothetical protein [Zunongwangia sp. F363]